MVTCLTLITLTCRLTTAANNGWYQSAKELTKEVGAPIGMSMGDGRTDGRTEGGGGWIGDGWMDGRGEGRSGRVGWERDGGVGLFGVGRDAGADPGFLKRGPPEGRTDEWTEGRWMDGRTDGREVEREREWGMDGWMDGWMDG